MKKLRFTLLGAIIYVIVVSLLTGYGNKSSHREINGLIVQKFNEVFINSLYPPDQFKNVLFVYNSGIKFPGSFISAGGLTQFDIEETQEELNPLGWIVHGGYSADEPEIFASFRHFYDPTEREGNRYLHNHLDELDKKGIVANPRIDILNWAVNHNQNQYNWANGKTAIISALQTEDKDFRDEEMAFAWRALGETLHMIADMGCPAHVRDDAHAAETFTGYQLGSPDPYEEFFEVISAEEGINNLFKEGKVDADLKDKFRKAQTIHEIAHELAVYSNKNFFTTQTITGDGYTPIIHPEKTYPSPTLDQCTYDPIDFAYYKNISGNNVMMCRDLKYALGIFKGRGYPYIDKKCTYSQAKALLPQIVEAGINVVKLFIPEMKVEVKKIDLENKKLNVVVNHQKNTEYPREIKYNGKVSIYNAKNRNHLADFECVNGVVDADLKKKDFFSVNWEDHGVYAEIEYGGLFVKSEPYFANDDKSYTSYQMFVTLYCSGTYERSVGNVGGSVTYDKRNIEDAKIVLNYYGELQRSGNVLYHDLNDENLDNQASTADESHKGSLMITLDKNNEIERVEIDDLIVLKINNEQTDIKINYKSKSFPFKNGDFNVFVNDYVCEGEDTEIVTNQWGILKNDITESFTYNLYEAEYGKEDTDFMKIDYNSYKPEQTMQVNLYIGGVYWLCD